jgi:hypothetical protein
LHAAEWTKRIVGETMDYKNRIGEKHNSKGIIMGESIHVFYKCVWSVPPYQRHRKRSIKDYNCLYYVISPHGICLEEEHGSRYEPSFSILHRWALWMWINLSIKKLDSTSQYSGIYNDTSFTNLTLVQLRNCMKTNSQISTKYDSSYVFPILVERYAELLLLNGLNK